MGILNLNATTSSTNVADVTISRLSTDGISEQPETEWTNSDWTKYWGQFNTQPDLQTAILLKSYWTLGGGYTCDIPTDTILNNVTGWGKDTFFDILFNMDVVRNVGGDSYAHIIRDAKTGIILNVKPLDPGSMKHVVDSKGILIRYEQINKLAGVPVKKFKPEEILHLSCNRLADQIHGISRIKALTAVTEAYNETFVDNKQVMHNQARPLILWKLKTDDTGVINSFVAKINAARKLGNDMFIPDDTESIKHELVSVPISPVIMAYRDGLRNDFYRGIQLPQIIPGGAGQSTESESKTIYFAHELIVKKDQLAFERQLKHQLGLTIKIQPAPSMQPEIQRDTGKDNNIRASQPSDTTAGAGR